MPDGRVSRFPRALTLGTLRFAESTRDSTRIWRGLGKGVPATCPTNWRYYGYHMKILNTNKAICSILG